VGETAIGEVEDETAMNEGGVFHLILRSPLPGRSLYLTECYKNCLWEGRGGANVRK
jgi:hypothetical protein